MRIPLLLSVLVSGWASTAFGQTVAEIAAAARPSIVVVTPENRDGRDAGLGAGFVVGKAGLIATALHVIGEARPVWVQTQDGKRHEVIEVFASDRSLDLAILRIKADDLPALPLAAEGSTLEPGQMTVAIGHPLGLTNSVVSGQVAGTRDFRGVSHWQVGMTIEPGNSGCPLLNEKGDVHGVVVMKSIGREPFGFAVQVEHLRKLLDRPNPISMANWKTIGRIDTRQWQPLMDARWRKRSGHIHVEGAGAGFGGRSLLLRADDPPDVPFEVAVSVKLDDESGAAGLVFHADGGNKHYGFYPSAGRLRLTSFEGPTVFTWNVIQELDTPHYKRGDWNEIKLRVEKDKIVGFVNGREVVSVNEIRQPKGRIGLCKFRDTKAEFKWFRFGDSISSTIPLEADIERLATEMRAAGPRSELLNADLQKYTGDVLQRIDILEREAKVLESKAAQLRKFGEDIHVLSVCQQLKKIVQSDTDQEIDLMMGALWIARLDNPELEIASYMEFVDAMVRAIQSTFAEQDDAPQKLKKIDAYLFEQNGFHGSRTDYYNAANSHLDRVLDDREGLPITLSVLYMTLAQRLGLSVVGVGLPGHFVVRHERADGESQLIDVFEKGVRLTRAEADRMVLGMTGRRATDAHFESAKHSDILHRMLVNLLGVAQRDDEPAAMLRYLEAIVAMDPANASMRGMRGVLRHRQGRKQAALEDIDWILAEAPDGVDLLQVRRMRDLFSE